MIARIGILQGGATTAQPITAGNYRYTRVLNKAGAIEMDIADRRVRDWIDLGAYAEVMCDGRIDAVYRLMDYERGKSGVYRVYGEDMMHLLARFVLRAPAGTDDAQWSGDAGAGICAIAATFANFITSASYYSPGMMRSLYVAPTVSVTVKYAWATALEAMQEIAQAAREKGYLLWFGIGAARCVPHIAWSLNVHAWVWGRARTIAYRATRERYTTSTEGSVVVALGRGVGEARARHIYATPTAVSHRMNWWERRTDARVSGAVVSEAAAAIARWMRDGEYLDPFVASNAYWRDIDLGDAIYVTGERGGDVRIITGVTVSATQAGRTVEFDTYEVER